MSMSTSKLIVSVRFDVDEIDCPIQRKREKTLKIGKKVSWTISNLKTIRSHKVNQNWREPIKVYDPYFINFHYKTKSE